MNDMLEYKGFQGSVEYSTSDDILYGKIEFIRDLVDYQGTSLEELKIAFRESVDDYLTACKQLNKEPDRPFKGSFNIRIGESLHRDAYYFALKQKISLNELAVRSIEYYIRKKMIVVSHEKHAPVVPYRISAPRSRIGDFLGTYDNTDENLNIEGGEE